MNGMMPLHPPRLGVDPERRCAVIDLGPPGTTNVVFCLVQPSYTIPLVRKRPSLTY